MIVREIAMCNFMRHADTTVRLPECGITLVHGANGAGKSALIEAVAAAVWGESLRGASPWLVDRTGEVRVVGDSINVMRRRSEGGRMTLAWHLVAQPSEGIYPTTTKAQEALQAHVGEFDFWRRTHVLSSADAAVFTLARDSERKRLLESAIGVDFDGALKVCKQDVRAAEGALQGHRVTVARLQAGKEEAQRAVEACKRTEAVAAPTMDVLALRNRRRELQGMLDDVEADVLALQRSTNEAHRAYDFAAYESTAAERRLTAVLMAECDQCGQPIGKATLEKRRAEAGAASKTAAEVHKKKTETVALIAAEVQELVVQRERFTGMLRALDVEIGAAVAQEAHVASARAEVASAEQRLEALMAQLAGAAAQLTEAANALGVVEAAAQVLGLQGVRAQVIARALAGIEASANAWLARVAGEGLRLRLKPYVEHKNGSVEDAISLEVEGAGGGHGYKAASTGERRRIDVALLFALADVASAARSQEPGTLWIDECMDGLDAEGRANVVTVLREIAQERGVVVVSHDAELARSLAPVQRLHVTDGRVEAA